MVNPHKKENEPFEIGKDDQGQPVLSFKGSMSSEEAPSMLRHLIPLTKEGAFSGPVLLVDLHGVDYFDDFGILVLVELKKVLQRQGRTLQITGGTKAIMDMLDLYRFDTLGKGPPFARKSSPGMFLRLGEATLLQLADARRAISFVGSICIALAHLFAHPKSLRKEETLSYMQTVGVDSLPIVALISFLMGLIMAFMSSVQLAQFGANIYVASLVSLAMTRELGPIMTAIIVAGRSGSSFAAEIGTMKISDEVDALYTMGFDPVRFLVIPKLLAAVVMVPILTLFSDLFAILGGLLVGITMLDLTTQSYVAQTIKTLKLFDVFWGVFKSAVFAALITWIGCLRGFQVSGGAAGVGKATTSAVVSSIFLIILSDALFSVLLRYWG